MSKILAYVPLMLIVWVIIIFLFFDTIKNIRKGKKKREKENE